MCQDLVGCAWADPCGGGKLATCVVVTENREGHILHIARALSAARGFTRGLDGWQQKRDENPNDRNDDQKLHERKPARRAATKRGEHFTNLRLALPQNF